MRKIDKKIVGYAVSQPAEEQEEQQRKHQRELGHCLPTRAEPSVPTG